MQQRRKLEQRRHDARVREIKKLQPLCISKGFVEYAYQREWNNETADAAALFMHCCFMRQREFKNSNHKNSDDDGWVPFPYQVFEEMYGKHYRKFLHVLSIDGFLEYNEKHGYIRGSHCSQYRLCEELRENEISASYHLKSKVMQEKFITHKSYWKSMSNEKRLELVAKKIDTFLLYLLIRIMINRFPN